MRSRTSIAGLAVMLAFPFLVAAAPIVSVVSPAANSRAASPVTPITIDFTTPLDPTSVNDTTFKIFGHWSGVPQGNITFENNNQRLRFTPTRGFNAGEYVIVNLAKGIKDANGQPMNQGYAWMFWTKPSEGSMDLQEIDQLALRRTGEGHIQTYGAYGGDFDGDGWMDLAMSNEITDDVRVMMNDGTGMYSTFEVFPLPSGNTPSPNEGADFNGDGKLDYAVGNAGNDRLTVMLGDGTGDFSSLVSYQAGNGVRGVCVLDLDGDGDWDIVTAHRSGNNLGIHLNNGDGTFAARVLVEANGTQETACAVGDANNDGILDVFVGSYGSNEIGVMLGNGSGGLTFSAERPAKGKPWMIAVGDINGDGNIDVVSANSNFNNAAVVYGNGAGGLDTAITYPVGSFTLAIDVGDIDGDGDLDLITSNYGSGDWTVYENNGSGVYGNVRTLDASTAGSCATLYDRDNDGDLDMTGIDELDDLVFLFENPGVVAVKPDNPLPSAAVLLQNYPNPFNPVTKLQFQIVTSERVSLKVYDMLGREVAVVVNEFLSAGEHEYAFDGNGLAGGVYVARLATATSFAEPRKLVLVK
ncbi:MAG: FG-GAP-like repeat-containing protein [Bacteroidota bacterium]